MQKAPIPPNEEERLRVLTSYRILDTAPEAPYDDVVRLASEICGTPMALVSLVDRDRQWFKAVVGLDVTETPRDLAFCAHAILQEGTFVVRDAHTDERFADNPLVVSAPNVRFYAGTPLVTPGGIAVGTLCVIDTVPRDMTPLQQRALRTLGRQIEVEIELRLKLEELRASEAESRAQRDALACAEHQREELASFIVHDLKGPLSGLVLNAEFILAQPVDASTLEAATDIKTAADAMSRLANDLLDVGRVGDGALVSRPAIVDLADLFHEIRRAMMVRVDERGQEVAVSVAGDAAHVWADRDLLQRLLHNLMDNAVKYGGSAGEIRLEATSGSAGSIELRVRDRGAGIPAAYRDRIFDKYVRLDRDAAHQARLSAGLGLAFCKLAAEVHGGRIWVEDNAPTGSVFCVNLPQAPLALAA